MELDKIGWLTHVLFRRFVGAEKWRKDTKLDEILPTWDYPEKEAVMKFYPQYYHKTDKVCYRIIIPESSKHAH